MGNSNIHPGDDIKILMEFYKDNVAYQRHHEDIRFKGSQLIVTLTGILIASLKFTSVDGLNYVIAVFIILLGLLGLLQVLKHTERADRHAVIARAYRKKIGQVAAANAATSVEEIHRHAAASHKDNAHITYKMRARWFWLCMHMAIVILGFAVIVLLYGGKLNAQ